MKIDVRLQPTEIFTKLLQVTSFVYKQARIPGFEGGVPPQPKAKPEDAAGLETTAQEPAGLAQQLIVRQREAAAPAGAGMEGLTA